jgi:hypothetical protein
MTLTIDFTDEQIRGITSAREAHNANPPSESDAPFATNEEYLTWVISKAADSYASQYPA